MTISSPAPLPFLDGTRPEEGTGLVVNLFGGPGVGKSTLASKIFAGLKERGIEAACPEEHAKLAIWSGQPWLLQQQTVLLGRTWETIHALISKVDVIIVDSPLLLCSIYAGPREPDCFHDLCSHLHKRSRRLNLLVSRGHGVPYSERGRMQNESEALAFDSRIAAALHTHNEPIFAISQAQADIGELMDGIVAALPRSTRASGATSKPAGTILPFVSSEDCVQERRLPPTALDISAAR